MVIFHSYVSLPEGRFLAWQVILVDFCKAKKKLGHENSYSVGGIYIPSRISYDGIRKFFRAHLIISGISINGGTQ